MMPLIPETHCRTCGEFLLNGNCSVHGAPPSPQPVDTGEEKKNLDLLEAKANNVSAVLQNTVQLEVVDRGHAYGLPSFDGEHFQTLTFMKREGAGYPGNIGAYPGTNLQSVLRACVDRVIYLQGQMPHENNIAIICHLRHCLRELEQRAAERHGFNVNAITLEKASSAPMCAECGHVACSCKFSVSRTSPALDAGRVSTPEIKDVLRRLFGVTSDLASFVDSIADADFGKAKGLAEKIERQGRDSFAASADEVKAILSTPEACSHGVSDKPGRPTVDDLLTINEVEKLIASGLGKPEEQPEPNLSTQNTLKPCPFCGGEAILRETHRNHFVAVCLRESTCGCELRLGFQPDLVAAIWNKRAVLESART